MQKDNDCSIDPPSQLISQMEDLYEKYQDINDSSKGDEIKEEANEILIKVVSGLEEEEYEGFEIELIFELHKKICITNFWNLQY